MKFIKRALLVLGFLVVIALIIDIFDTRPTPFDTGGQQFACEGTAQNFLPAEASGTEYLAVTPFNGLDQGAWALAARPDGRLAVGGDFLWAGSAAAHHVALWNPAARQWSAMGEGLPYPVHELVSTPSGDLYALTRQKKEGSTPLLRVYRWRDPAWELLPELFSGDEIYFRDVQTMVGDGRDGFFLGGNFSSAGGFAVNGIIHWDGQAWQPLPQKQPEEGILLVRALAVAADGRLLAAATLKTSINEVSEVVLAWNNDGWTRLGQALPGPVESLAAASDGRLAVLVALPEGPSAPDQYRSVSKYSFSAAANRWSPDPASFPVSAVQFQIAFDLDHTGAAVQPVTAPPAEIAAWEGSLWQARANPFRLEYEPKPSIRLFVLSQRLYVLGAFDRLGSTAADNIAAWDGQSWDGLSSSVQPLSGISGTVKTLVIDHQGNLLAGGSFQEAGSSMAANIARWDGSAWAPLGDGTNNTVFALAVDQQDRVVAGGNFTAAGGNEAYGVARFEKQSGAWQALADRESPGFGLVSALAVAPNGTLYAAGLGSAPGGTGYYVAAWDDQQWQVLPGVFDQAIRTLLVDSQGRVFAGGSFRSVSGDPVMGLARWDAPSGRWLNLGSGFGWSPHDNRSVSSLLESPDGALIVGGYFFVLDGRPICQIARFLPDAHDGKGRWEELAGGLPWLGTMAYGPDGSLYAATSLPRPNGESDAQLVVLRPGASAWQMIGGIIGEIHSPREVNALAVHPNGWLAVGGVFELAGGQPAHNITILLVTGR